MKFKQLIVHDDAEWLGALTSALERGLGSDAAVTVTLNLEAARKALQSKDDKWSLVVLHATARANASAKGRRTCDAACKFVAELKAGEPKLPVIAIASNPCPQLSGLLQAWRDTATLKFGFEAPEVLQRLARELSSNAANAMAETLELALDFTPQGQCNWRLVSHGRWNEWDNGSYLVDRATLQDLHWMARSRSTGEFLEWMQQHSLKMGQLVFQASDPASQAFWRQFVDWRARVGGIENTRIRMSAQDEHIQDVVLEALKDSEAGSDFWMLKAPIIRQYKRGRGSQDLFPRDLSMRRPIKALVILSDCGEQRGGSARLPAPMRQPLEQAEREMRDIVELMREAGARTDTVSRVETLELDRMDMDIHQTLQDKLAEQWDLVHFIGHGLAPDPILGQPLEAARHGKAELVLAVLEDDIVCEDFATFAGQLAQTRFLFLSCCRGGSRGFLAQAATQMVPTTLGYRWEVEDSQARAFARDFYAALFNREQRSFQSPEYAFVEARSAAFTRQKNGATWAAPLLMTQFALAGA